MVFKGYGVIWNPKKGKALCNFKNGEYETTDFDEIAILKACPQAGYVSGEMPEPKEVESKEPTKNEIMALLDEKEIEYNPRDKKDVLLSLLEVE